MTVFTIGHSTRTAEQLIALLQRNGVNMLVDVRTIPRSRTNPQFNQDALPLALEPAGIGYRHMKALGGLRGKPKEGSRNTAWRNGSFRNYADYAATPAFRDGLRELQTIAQRRTPSIMCAEAVWWRCHRRIIADYLLAGGIDVRHILSEAPPELARLTPGAQLEADGSLVYAGVVPDAPDLFASP